MRDAGGRQNRQTLLLRRRLMAMTLTVVAGFAWLAVAGFVIAMCREGSRADAVCEANVDERRADPSENERQAPASHPIAQLWRRPLRARRPRKRERDPSPRLALERRGGDPPADVPAPRARVPVSAPTRRKERRR